MYVLVLIFLSGKKFRTIYPFSEEFARQFTYQLKHFKVGLNNSRVNRAQALLSII